MQRDLVLRWIEQLGRLVARLVGLGGKAELGAARDQVAEATINLLGPLSLLVPRLETSSAAAFLAMPSSSTWTVRSPRRWEKRTRQPSRAGARWNSLARLSRDRPSP